MKKFKIVPELNYNNEPCFRIYRRRLMVLWELVGSFYTVNGVKEALEHLEGSHGL